MKLVSTILILFFTTTIYAQNITGIWRGRFQQTNIDALNSTYSTETYKYEVQINQLDNDALEGVTYSYLTTVFYGKASLKGVFSKKGKTLTLKETIMLDMKATGRSEPCLMTCYLDYTKVGKLEILTGTYTSIKSKDKSDCGTGTVYLERVVESDFEKESFLLKKKPVPLKTKPDIKEGLVKDGVKKNSNNNSNKPKTENNTVKQKANTSIKQNNSKNNAIARNNINPKKNTHQNQTINTINKPRTIKPGAEDYVVKKDNKKQIIDSAVVKVAPKEIEEPVKPNKEIKPEKIVKQIAEPTAEVLLERENKLVNKIIVDDKYVTLEFYDNGEIDNDTISVYKDNQLVVDKKRLSTNPIVLNLKFDEINTFYEVITVAENLGDIPPNTALMVITYGNNKRREVFLTSDEKTNAKIIVEYKAK